MVTQPVECDVEHVLDLPRALLTQHRPLASSLVSGYHLAFVIGALCVATGIVLALALLRARKTPVEVRSMPSGETSDDLVLEGRLEIERQAA